MLPRVGRSWLCVLSMSVVVAVVSSSAWAVSVVKIQPGEAESADVFTYQFHGPDPGFNVGNFPDTLNLDTDSVPVASPIGQFLGTSRTPTTVHNIDLATGEFSRLQPDGTGSPVLTGHDSFSWLRFDNILGVGVNPSLIENVTLNLWSLDGFSISGSFYNPIAIEQVETEIYAAGGPWVEQDLTWENQEDGVLPALPAFGSPVDSVIQSSVERWVSFDVTSLVVDWLADPATNHGVVLRQKEVVLSMQGAVAFTGVVSSLYASSAYSDASLRPFLQITTSAPEPATAVMSLMSAFSLVQICRRRKGVKG